MTFTPKTWQDYPGSTATPINAAALADLETRLSGYADGSSVFTRTVSDVGVANQVRAGRQLIATDFTTLLGLTTPLGLFNLGDLTNLGSGGALSNKGSVTFTSGINGTATTAAQFTGSTAQSLYIADVGASDPFRIKSGSWGCWFRTAKRGVGQGLIMKVATGPRSWYMWINNNVVTASISLDGTTDAVVLGGLTDVADDRWHFGVTTFDGTLLRVYVDGALESTATVTGPIAGSAAPFNIGSFAADGSTAAQGPNYGRIDEAFVTGEVLDETQIRLLMAAKTAHGFSTIPAWSRVSVQRKRRGGALVTGDFTATPKMLYNFTTGALTDAGSLGLTLTNVNSAVPVSGADGQVSGAFQTSTVASSYFTNAGTGLPVGTAARTYGAWFKNVSTQASNSMPIVAHGGTDFRGLYLSNLGLFRSYDGTTVLDSGIVLTDGQWHFGVLSVDNAAVDGLKRKLYLDGRLVASDTNLASTTGGTFYIGRDSPGEIFPGTIDSVFATDYAMGVDEIRSLYAKSVLSAPASEKNQADHVEAMDSIYTYHLFDTLESQHSVTLRVGSA